MRENVPPPTVISTCPVHPGDRPPTTGRRSLQLAPEGRNNRAYSGSPPRCTVGRMEGLLRRINDHSWTGELHGYRVHIAKLGGQWNVWLMPGGAWTERCFPVGSLAEGARQAREWIEQHGDKRLRSPKRE